jgi:hypothetical protein
MMSDRLAELVRQRALVQEHLAWLNREIAAAAEAAKSIPAASGATTGGSPSIEAAPSPTSPPAALRPAVAIAASAGEPAEAQDPDAIIARYQVAPGTVKQDVRKGCMLYFVGAFVLLGLVVAVLYMALQRGH